MIREEWAKFRVMNFAEKRWYLWEYYKLQMGGILLAIFILGSVANAILNPRPAEYLYIAWDNVPAFDIQLYELSEGLSVIVADPERQAVFITDYTVRGNRQFDDNMRMRFIAMLQMGAIDALITNGEGIQAAFDVEDGRVVIGNLDRVLEYTDIEVNERFVFYRGQVMAVSLYGSPILENFGIDSSDAYFCIIVNSRRPREVAAALEVFLYGS
ncbi:MAG: hypothetical protein FWF77_08665 [Defluviitaleaceae bacterium]|nr:hypothetical protein [Defluviitaleaceae bacterium]